MCVCVCGHMAGHLTALATEEPTDDAIHKGLHGITQCGPLVHPTCRTHRWRHYECAAGMKSATYEDLTHSSTQLKTKQVVYT